MCEASHRQPGEGKPAGPEKTDHQVRNKAWGWVGSQCAQLSMCCYALWKMPGPFNTPFHVAMKMGYGISSRKMVGLGS